jgi:uncharacterized protein
MSKVAHMANSLDIQEILEQSRTVAVVGISANPDKAAHAIPASLQAAGFKILPVNPNATEVLGEAAYESLADISEPVDIVEVFRPAPEAPQIARDAVAIGAKTLWLQKGIVSTEAREIAESNGVNYIEDRCMSVERSRYGITKPSEDQSSRR